MHQGSYPENALALMRSRYSAYALGLTDYIIRTTHPENPGFQKDQKAWSKEIEAFSKNTEFTNLTILEFIDGDSEAIVAFDAELIQNNATFHLREKSHFIKVGPQWLYRLGFQI